jgi:hypothetical protein
VRLITFFENGEYKLDETKRLVQLDNFCIYEPIFFVFGTSAAWIKGAVAELKQKKGVGARHEATRARPIVQWNGGPMSSMEGAASGSSLRALA